MNDASNPKFYGSNGVPPPVGRDVQLIEAVEQNCNWNEGCVIKYVYRHRHKGTGLADLNKALWHLTRLREQYLFDHPEEKQETE